MTHDTYKKQYVSSILDGTDLSGEFGKSMNGGTVVVSCGAKGSGKSTFMLSILRASVEASAYEDYILVFPSLFVEQHDSYAWCMKQKEFTIYTNYHNLILEKLYHQNKDLKKQKKTLVIIDDATTFAKELRLATNENLIALVSQARHLKVTLWILVHSLKNILSPCLRENSGWLLIYSITNAKLLKDVHEDFLSVYCDYNEFIKWYRNMSNKQYCSFMLKTGIPVAIDTNSNNWKTTVYHRNLNNTFIHEKKTAITAKHNIAKSTTRSKPNIETL